jgi:RHS repeat-associated protein
LTAEALDEGNSAAIAWNEENGNWWTGETFPVSSVKNKASYYRARYYDPSSGRFFNEDPEAFRGGLDFYAYSLNRSLNYTDPSGKIPLPLITDGIGAIAGGVGDLVGQEIGNIKNGRSLRNVDLKEVGVATGVGAAAGALAPITATTWAGAALSGALANLAQKYILNRWEHKCSTAEEYVGTFILGAAGGALGGPAEVGNAFSASSPFLDRGVATASNQAIKIGAATSGFARSVGGGVLGSLPFDATTCDCH